MTIDVGQLMTDLTPAQRQAATHVEGPLLIIAAAGSGKTRVLTRRVAYLISQGIPAPSILALTFTNKAAGEMKQRIAAAVDRPIRDFGRLDQQWPTICTFHSLGLRIIRHYSSAMGLHPNFSIYDSGDQNKLVKDALKSLDINATNFTPGTVHGAISKAKNKLLGPDEFARQATDFFQRTVARVYTKYQEMLLANNALDFDDLLLRTAQAFRDQPIVLRELQDRFQYLLIDEYQDTNHAQYVIAHAMAHRHRNICVVGDPDQSIYAWRGADLQNILDFENDYRDATVVKLEQNYRSTRNILAIASKLIANNTQRKDKGLWSENAAGAKGKLFICQDEHDEAHVITEQMKRLHDDEHLDWNKMAIFYRMNALSRVMEDALRRAGVPYQIARGTEFYNRKEIKDVLAYLRVVANPDDEVSLSRIANVPPRGLGDTSVKQLQVHAVANGFSLLHAMANAAEATGISARAQNAAKTFVMLVRGWQKLALGQPAVAPAPPNGTFADLQTHSVKGVVQRVMEAVVRQSGYEALLRKAGDKELDELSNVGQLISAAAEYDAANPGGSLDDYLAQVSLVSDADHMKGAGGAVTLMTLHAAKGLEFPAVAIIGLEEGCLPHSRARGNLKEMEEERRLCFVGITRAQEHLLLSKAAYRTLRGQCERTITSPFLKEMPQELLKISDRTRIDFDNGKTRAHHAGRHDPCDARDEIAPNKFPFQKGQRVRHPAFGIGRVAEMSEAGTHTRAVVDFTTAGRKTLILQYAKLEAAG